MHDATCRAASARQRAAAQHSQTLEAMFIPGLKVMPATPDAKAFDGDQDDNPVMFLEHKALYSMKGSPGGDYTVP